jgi:hypothetical protein
MIYIFRNDEQIGPISEKEIIQKLACGDLLPTDFAWKEGMEDWQPLSTIISSPTNKPRFRAKYLLIGAGVAALALLLAFWWLSSGSSGPEAVVKAYLNAKTWEERVPFVITGEVFSGTNFLEARFAAGAHPERYKGLKGPVAYKSVKMLKESRPFGGFNFAIPKEYVTCEAVLSDDSKTLYYLKETPEGYKIMWNLIRLNMKSTAALKAEQPSSELLYVSASLDDYWNYGFKPGTHYSVRLDFPDGGYVHSFVEHKKGSKLFEILKDGRSHCIYALLSWSKGNPHIVKFGFAALGWLFGDEPVVSLFSDDKESGHSSLEQSSESKNTKPAKKSDMVTDSELGPKERSGMAMVRLAGVAAGAKFATEQGRLPTKLEFAAFLAQSGVEQNKIEQGSPEEIRTNRRLAYEFRTGFEQGCRQALGIIQDASSPAF